MIRVVCAYWLTLELLKRYFQLFIISVFVSLICERFRNSFARVWPANYASSIRKVLDVFFFLILVSKAWHGSCAVLFGQLHPLAVSLVNRHTVREPLRFIGLGLRSHSVSKILLY